MSSSPKFKSAIFGFLTVAFGLSGFVPQGTLASGATNLRIEILPLCGNDIRETGEVCDGTDLGGESCSSQGYSRGTLSCVANCGSFVTSACIANTNGEGVGGGGGSASYYSLTPITSVVLNGWVYPGSTVTILKDGQIAATTVADANAAFLSTITGLAGGNYIFGVYAEDADGLKSSTLTFPTSVSFGSLNQVSDIFLAPTLAVDRSEMALSETLRVFGRSMPKAQLSILMDGDTAATVTAFADSTGAYAVDILAQRIGTGKHRFTATASFGGVSSVVSTPVDVVVGTKNVPLPIEEPPTPTVPVAGNMNNDGKVDLVDLSIAVYWYRRPLSADMLSLEATYFNGDGKIDLVDFSIMAFHWTG